MRRAFLAQLTLLWAVCTQAFYIFYPDYLCSQDKICPASTGSRRSLDDRSPRPEAAGTPEGSITFELFQKKSGEPEDVVNHAIRNAARLMRKYAPGPTSTSNDHRELERRATNTYSINAAATPTTASSEGVDQDGTDFSYFVKVGVGASQKSMYMLLDTGAGTTWVMGSSCTSAACLSHNTFGSSDSTSYVASTKTFSIDYGSGSVAGALVKDSLTVASMKASMTFGVANTTSSDFTNFPFDGILGLSISAGATDNFLSVLKTNKVLSSNIFGVTLSRASDGANSGEITFGAIDASRYTGSISYNPVLSSAAGDWAISMGDLGYNGATAGISGRTAYMDTGTTYAFGPPADVAALHKLIPGATSKDGVTYTLPCTSNLPLTVSFGGVTYNISSKDWLSGSGTTCTSNFYGREVVPGAWLLGDVFLKNVYTVFDWDASRIGFASKPVTSTATTTTTTATATTMATITGAPSTSTTDTAMLGLSGHETSATSGGTAAADSSGAQPTAAATHASSPGEQLGSNKYVSMLCVVAVIAMVA